MSSDYDDWEDVEDFDFDSLEPLQELEIDESAVIPELTEEQKQQSGV